MANRADKKIRFEIVGDASQLSAGLRQAASQLSGFEKRLTAFAGKFDKIGRAVQRNLVLPLAAVGGVSVKLAADFEASMQKIVALVGLPQEQVESFKEGVKDLAVETGRSAKELADAMFFITSAGIRGGASGDPMAVLAASAKAAAAGMGETKIVADALTSAVNAYGAESLSAAEATDVLVATIREGKLEADQVSAVIGKVIPIAAELGVEFSEVGAAIATMSRIGIDADVGSTALRAMLNGLLKPTADTEKAFREVGISGEMLRTMLADEGLLATLLFLQKSFEGNSTAMGRAFPNIRALTGVLGILADNAKQANIIFDALADNTGDTDRAFQAVADTTKFTLSQAFASLKVAAIELGDALAPMIKDIADQVRGMTSAFSGLPAGIQETITKIGAFTLVGGVAIVVMSKLVNVAAALVGGLAKMATWGARAAAAFTAMTAPLQGPMLAPRRLGGIAEAFKRMGTRLAGIATVGFTAAAAVAAIGYAISVELREARERAADIRALSDALDELSTHLLNEELMELLGVEFGQATGGIAGFDFVDVEEAMVALRMSQADVIQLIEGGRPALEKWLTDWRTSPLYFGKARDAVEAIDAPLGNVISRLEEAKELDAAKFFLDLDKAWDTVNAGFERSNPIFETFERMDGWIEQRIPVISEAFRLLAQRTRDSFVDQMEVVREWRDEVAGRVESVVGLFKETPDQIAADFTAWENELTGQQDVLKRWSDGIVALMDAGLTNLALEIYEAGPEAADAVTELLANMEDAVNFETLLVEMQTFVTLVEGAVADALDGIDSLYEAAFKGFFEFKRLLEFGFTPGQLFTPLEGSEVPSGEADQPGFTRQNPGLVPFRIYGEGTSGRPSGQTVYVDTVNLYAEVENDPSTARRILEELADGIQRLDREGVN